MRLHSMTATFGCLNNETLELDRAMTVITAPNGAGKSTWCAFLRTMLYGLDSRQRDRKDAPAEKNRYRPWSGKPMSGSLLCEYQGELIEIRRTSDHGLPMGDFSARYQESGLPVPGLTGENVGETLLGVGREVFDRSAFLRQTGLAVERSRELEQRMAALVTSGEEETSYSQAAERLKEWQHRRRYHRSGLLPQLEQEETALGKTIAGTAALRRELEETEARADSLRRDTARWEEQLLREREQYQADRTGRQNEAVSALAAAEERLESLNARYEEARETDGGEELTQIQEDIRGRKRIFALFLSLILLLTAGLAAVYLLPRQFGIAAIPQFPLLVVAAVGGLLWVLLLLIFSLKAYADHRDRRLLRRLREQEEKRVRLCRELSRTIETARQERELAQYRYEALEEEAPPQTPPEAERCRTALAEAQQQTATLRGRLAAEGDPAVLDARLDNVQEEIRLLQRDYDALELAREALQRADSQLHARFSPQLCDRAGAYLERLTEGRYTGFSLTREFDISVQERGDPQPRPLSAVSQGTRDQLYLALRLAVADLVLPRPDDCPLVLDDALCSFDDRRLSLALDCLTALSEKRQILLFTCQRRERDALSAGQSVGFCTLRERGENAG